MSDYLPSVQLSTQPDAAPEAAPARPRQTRRPGDFFPALLFPVFSLLVVVNTLLTPVQTRQLKASEQLTGTRAERISYSLAFEHNNPQKITLKLAAARPVEVSLLENGQPLFQTVIASPPADTPAEVTIPLPAGLNALPPGESLTRGHWLQLRFEAGPWAVAYSERDVWPAGRLQPEPPQPAAAGDFYFVVDYGRNPGLLLGRFFERQARFGGFPVVALLVLAGAIIFSAAALIYLARRRERLFEEVTGTARGYRRFGAGLLGLSLLWSLAYLLINPPLQGPDEPAHVGRSIAAARGVSTESLKPATAALMQNTNFIDGFAWLSYEDEAVDLFSPSVQLRQGPLFYQVASLLVKGLGRGSPGYAAETYLTRLASVLFLLGTVGAGLACGWLLRKAAPWLALSLPVGTALLPQVLYLGSVANNDNAAICCSAWAAFAMLGLFRAGPGWKGPSLFLGLLAVFLGLGLLSKQTLITLVPAYGVGLWIVLLYRSPRVWRRRLVVASGVALVAGAGLLWLSVDSTTAAKGWYYTSFKGLNHAPRHATPPESAPASGNYTLRVTDTNSIEQAIDIFYEPLISQVRLELKTRPERAATAPARLKVELIGLEKPLAWQEVVLTGTDWQTVQLVADIPPKLVNSRLEAFIIVRFTARTPVLVDDVTMSGNASPARNLIANSSFEQSTLTLASGHPFNRPECGYCFWVRSGVDYLGNGRELELGGVFLQSIVFVLLTLWGTFSWGNLFLGGEWYALWTLLTLGACLGLGRLVLSRRLAGWQIALGLFCGACLLITFYLQFVVKALTWMATGSPDFVAGRFFLVALIPLLILGLGGWRGLARAGRTANRAWAGLWAWTAWLLAMNVVGLVGHIFLFYYNR